MILAIPEGYISLKDAFEHLLNAWEDGDNLVQAINHASNSGLNSSADDLAAREAQNAAWQAYEDAVRRIEQIVREAIVSGQLSAMIVDEYGRISKLDDRERWSEIALFPLGMETVPEPVINPGPVTEGRPAFFQTAAFEEWMSTVKHSVDPFHTGMPGKPTARHAVAAEHQRRLDAGLARLKVKNEAEELKNWLMLTYPSAPSMAVSTIENAIRDAHRGAKTKGANFMP
jgi:hypothetical protein